MKNDWFFWLRRRKFDYNLATPNRQIKMNLSERAKTFVRENNKKELVAVVIEPFSK
jgi:hypothetical protein